MKLVPVAIFLIATLNFSKGQNSSNGALEEYRLAKRTGQVESTPTPKVPSAAPPIAVDLSETKTSFQIMISLRDGSTEADYKLSYRDCYVKVRRSDWSAEVTLKLPSPALVKEMTSSVQSGKLVFTLPKSNEKPPAAPAPVAPAQPENSNPKVN